MSILRIKMAGTRAARIRKRGAMRKYTKAAMTVAAAGLLTVLAAIPAFAGQWQRDEIGWWWQNDDGSYPSWMWAWIDGDHDGIAENYYFDENGYLSTDTGSQGLTVNENGALLVNGAVCTARIPGGNDWYPGVAVDGGMFVAEADRSEVNAIEAAMAAEREAREREAAEREDIDPSELALRIVELVNEERGRKGKAELAVNEELMESARVRAEEVSEYFSHTRPDGTSCLTAITLEYAAASENAACVYGDTLEKIAQDAVEGWCASPGHHIAILQSKWESTGVGVYVDGTEVSIVQLFIKNK